MAFDNKMVSIPKDKYEAALEYLDTATRLTDLALVKVNIDRAMAYLKIRETKTDVGD